jgi:hypothetical protein
MTVTGEDGHGVPLSALEGIGAMAQSHDPSWTLVDARLPRALGVTLVIGSRESLDAWCQEVEQNLLKTYDDPLLRWWRGTTTGKSSLWLLSCLFGDTYTAIVDGKLVEGRPTWLPLPNPAEEAYPRDASDFGRCVNLLDSTGLRPRLGEARGRWAPYVARWPELEQAWLLDKRDEVRQILDAVWRP